MQCSGCSSATLSFYTWLETSSNDREGKGGTWRACCAQLLGFPSSLVVRGRRDAVARMVAFFFISRYVGFADILMFWTLIIKHLTSDLSVFLKNGGTFWSSSIEKFAS